MRIILDTDLNFPSDDFQALLLLLNDPRIDLLGCCAAAGNTWAEEVAANLEQALRMAGHSHVPVLAGPRFDEFSPGRELALSFKARSPSAFTGAYEKSSEPRRWIAGDRSRWQARCPAGEFLAEVASSHATSINLACIGPLTNIAVALKQCPDLPRIVRRVFVMGGYFSPSGSPAARPDFNVWFDPDSAQAILNSGMNVMLLPREVCRSACVNPEFIKAVCDRTAGLAGLFADDFFGMAIQHGPHMALCDQLLAAIIRNPDLILATERGHVSVDCSHSPTRGFTAFRPSADGPVELIRQIVPDAFRSTLLTWLDAMQCQPAPACDRLASPRFQYLIQAQLEDAPVAICELHQDGDTFRIAPLQHVRSAAEFVRHAGLLVDLLLRMLRRQPSARLNPFTIKRIEQLVCDNLSCAKIVVMAKTPDGDCCGVTCLRPSSMPPLPNSDVASWFNFADEPPDRNRIRRMLRDTARRLIDDSRAKHPLPIGPEPA